MQTSHQRELRVMGREEDIFLFDDSVNDFLGF
jgi:hypothetical protein